AHVFNCRSETASAFRVPLRNNWPVVGAVVVAHVLHISAAWIPGLRDVLEVTPVTLTGWLEIVPAALSVIAVSEIYKFFRRQRPIDEARAIS
ncbi:MAG: cation transporting ATPase C-terminal domain-containing protein, partial [Thermoanaerobaculia bacterium]